MRVSVGGEQLGLLEFSFVQGNVVHRVQEALGQLSDQAPIGDRLARAVHRVLKQTTTKKSIEKLSHCTRRESCVSSQDK